MRRHTFGYDVLFFIAILATLIALAPGLAGTSGEFFVKNQPAKASAPAYDRALAAQLWAMSERLTGLAPSPGEQEAEAERRQPGPPAPAPSGAHE